MKQPRDHRLSIAAVLLVAVAAASAEPPKYGSHIEMPGLPGTLVLVGDGDIPDEALEAFVERTGGTDAKIGVSGPGMSSTLFPGVADDAVTLMGWGADGDEPLFDIESVTGYWFEGSLDGRLIVTDGEITFDNSQWEHVKRLLDAAFVRNAVIGASGDMARHIVASLPGMGYGDGSSGTGIFSVAIDANTALLISGRRGRVVGDGQVTMTLASSANRPIRRITQGHGTQFDLIALSRAAVARWDIEFPPKFMRFPVVESGTLFIGGGGQMPVEGMQRFIAASGGPDAPIVIIPTAIGRPDAATFGERNAQQLRALGATNVSVMHTMNPREADTEEFCTPLRDAGGIWFTGGRQWNLVDAYRGTLAHELMHDVLKRGGAIGGSSAGASIQAEYMVRGHPLGNTVMMAEGYERGLDFLPGVAVDQHFAQRERFKDLASVKHAFPQLLCLGIDEQTMIIVRGSVAEVVGPHNLQVYADPVPDDYDGTEYEQVKPGERYDLKARRKIDTSE